MGEKSSTVHEVQMQKRLSMQMYSSELALALKKSIGYKLQVWSIWSHSTISGKKKKKKNNPCKRTNRILRYKSIYQEIISFVGLTKVRTRIICTLILRKEYMTVTEL